MNDELILVMGKLCSGKGHFCKPYIEKGYHHITTSDVVKYVSGKIDRADLQDTHFLSQQISEELVRRIQQHKYTILDGVRQLTIVDQIVASFPHVRIIWLVVDANTRKQRFETRGDRKDMATTFEKAEQGDIVLGLSEIEQKISNFPNLTIITDY